MPEFHYVARAADGSLAQGTIEADDRATAIRDIESRKHTPIRIEQKANGNSTKAPTSSATAAKGKPPATRASPKSARPASSPESTSGAKQIAPGESLTLPLAQLFLFTEQLAHLLIAGMTLDEALGILVRRLQQPKLQSLCQALHQGLVDGRSLSQAMRDYPHIFSPLYVNMVSAGEASGALPQILQRLVTHLAGVKALRDRVTQALIYPAFLVVAGIGLIVIFITVMVPQLTGFFNSTGQKLPLPTQILLHANHILTHYGWVGALIAVGLYSLLKMGTRKPQGLVRWHHALWHFPAFSRILRYRFYAQFARTLGTLAENGVPLLKSLELLEEISGNEWVRLQMVEVRNAVMDGASLSKALRHQQLFPELYLDMMAVGEQTGRFAETMQMIADQYERELDKQVQLVSALVPPIVIGLIAIVVGLIVFGILSAVFNLTTGLQHPR